MLSESQLKEKLQALAQEDFHLARREELAELIPAMLKYIGSTDSELRDDLIYTAFDAWILAEPVLDSDQVRGLLPVILDEEHLRFKLGEQDTDSVFTRTFSVLVLPLLLIRHRSQPIFSAAEIQAILRQVCDYLTQEKDRRGYVPGKGWAHAAAHAADALDDLAECAELTQADLLEMLGVIRRTVCVHSPCYTCGEEERLASAVITVLKRKLVLDAELIPWIEGFGDAVLAVPALPERIWIRGNVKNFLQSLYFRLGWEGLPHPLETPIQQTLRRISPFAPKEGG